MRTIRRMGLPTPITIYRAHRVRTVNRSNPTAEAIAVSDGRIVGVGSVDELQRWGTATVDDRFADRVIVPGFVEAHAHAMEGALWRHTYVGYRDRSGPDGRRWPGCRSIDEVVDRLRQQDATEPGSTQPLVAWGLDPIYFAGERLLGEHLDRISTGRPILVMHASGHLATANSAMLRQNGIDASTPTPGVDKDGRGEPTGELQEPAAMGLARSGMGALFAGLGTDEAIGAFARLAARAGVTTVTDLGGLPLADDASVDRLVALAADPAFPARLAPFLATIGGPPMAPADAAERTLALRSRSTDTCLLGLRKLVLDGSIQGWTAQVSWPGYVTRSHHGQWLLPPEQVMEDVAEHHRRGLQVHAHCNGDLTTELFLDAIEAAMVAHPRPDLRHTVTHCQLTTPAQYRRMAALGVGANVFSNHLVTWGDQHRDLTVGPERARGMNAAATALRLGVALALHCDAPVTPLGALQLMWCAVNRVTESGQVLGEHERITPEQALEAVTIGPAYLLKLDHLVGSLEAGKLADFAVLSDDPLTVDPLALRDVEVVASCRGGVVREA